MYNQQKQEIRENPTREIATEKLAARFTRPSSFRNPFCTGLGLVYFEPKSCMRSIHVRSIYVRSICIRSICMRSIYQRYKHKQTTQRDHKKQLSVNSDQAKSDQTELHKRTPQEKSRSQSGRSCR